MTVNATVRSLQDRPARPSSTDRRRSQRATEARAGSPPPGRSRRFVDRDLSAREPASGRFGRGLVSLFQPKAPGQPPAAASGTPLSLISSIRTAPERPEGSGSGAQGPDAGLLPTAGEPLLSPVEHRERLCSTLGLGVKVALILVTGISLIRLASAYQERMERHAELRAVIDVQSAKLEKARDRFDHLFSIGGEQALIRQQGQWIAPNRLRVIWTR